MLHPLRRSALASALVFAVGCGSGQAANEPAKDPIAAAEKPAPAPPQVPPGHIARQDLDLALTRLGLPWLFRRVMREGVRDKNGAFAGWRLTGLPEEWSAVDVRPGDIVSRVNGLPLETPDNAWEAWKSLAKAKEIRITLSRDGATKDLVVPIDGAPTANVAEALDHDAPPPRKEDPQQRGVVRIGGDEDDESY